jgi:hypothetical protein
MRLDNFERGCIGWLAPSDVAVRLQDVLRRCNELQ